VFLDGCDMARCRSRHQACGRSLCAWSKAGSELGTIASAHAMNASAALGPKSSPIEGSVINARTINAAVDSHRVSRPPQIRNRRVSRPVCAMLGTPCKRTPSAIPTRAITKTCNAGIHANGGAGCPERSWIWLGGKKAAAKEKSIHQPITDAKKPVTASKMRCII
jgi:hypothetical protein